MKHCKRLLLWLWMLPTPQRHRPSPHPPAQQPQGHLPPALEGILPHSHHPGEEYRNKLNDKVKELLSDSTIEESRILTEVTIFADKVCVDEEIVRLKSHIETMKQELIAGGSIGRKLDFIAQEMNREANTVLSKANDLSISNIGIELKTEIEKVREQIQNIE